jgi:hypothetical protein
LSDSLKFGLGDLGRSRLALIWTSGLFMDGKYTQ